MPIPLIAGNWKMNTTVREAGVLAGHLRGSLGGVSGVGGAVPAFRVAGGAHQRAQRGGTV